MFPVALVFRCLHFSQGESERETEGERERDREWGVRRAIAGETKRESAKPRKVKIQTEFGRIQDFRGWASQAWLTVFCHIHAFCPGLSIPQ